MENHDLQKIGIMGGTFNPVHIGHLVLAETALTQFQLDKVLFMPNHKPDYKATTELLSADRRMEMISLAIEGNPFFELSDLELRRKGYTYTYETLEILKDKNPSHQYYFILGADSLFTFSSWKNPQRIADNCTILAATRNQTDLEELYHQIEFLKKQFEATIFILDSPELDISSKMLREKRKKHQSIRYFVPEKVYNYIINHDLYKSS